jgi:cytoskeletal protein CcmA (bactofilin family)
LPEPNQLATRAKPQESRNAHVHSKDRTRAPRKRIGQTICRPRGVQPHVHAGAIRRSSLQGVSIKGSVKFLNELLIDGEVEGTIDSTGTLTIGEHARIRGEIRTKSVKVQGTVESNIFVTECCELQAGCTLRGDIEAPRLVIYENATFLGSAKVGTGEVTPAWEARHLSGPWFAPSHG